MNKERRGKHRVQSQNLLYLSVRENGEIIQQGMGRTLNISESGVRLETGFALDSKKTVTLSIGIEDDIVDIQGKIVYYIRKEEIYEFGIRFLDVDERSRVILTLYIRLFNN